MSASPRSTSSPGAALRRQHHNGKDSQLLRKYAHNYYEMPERRKIDQDYRAAIQTAFKTQAWNDESQPFGLSREEILARLANSDGSTRRCFSSWRSSQRATSSPSSLISMLKPPDGRAALAAHAYPIFLRVKQPEDKGRYGYICLGVAFRIKQQIKIFSPFFASPSKQVVTLKSHISCRPLSTTSVSGCTCWGSNTSQPTSTTSHLQIPRQFAQRQQRKDQLLLVPKQDLQDVQSRTRRVNVAATASLVHPVARISLVNKVFNLSQEHVVDIIAGNSNLLKIYDFNPADILKNNGISEREQVKCCQKLNFDAELSEILTKYVENVYKLYGIEGLVDGLFKEINEQTKLMGIKKGVARPGLRNKEDVLKTIKNLCFCWVVISQPHFLHNEHLDLHPPAPLHAQRPHPRGLRISKDQTGARAAGFQDHHGVQQAQRGHTTGLGQLSYRQHSETGGPC